MKHVAGRTPLVMRGSVGEMQGPSIKAMDELAVFLQIEPSLRSNPVGCGNSTSPEGLEDGADSWRLAVSCAADRPVKT